MGWISAIFTSAIGKFILEFLWNKGIKALYRWWTGRKAMQHNEEVNAGIKQEVENAKTDEEKQAAANHSAQHMGRK